MMNETSITILTNKRFTRPVDQKEKAYLRELRYYRQMENGGQLEPWMSEPKPPSIRKIDEKILF